MDFCDDFDFCDGCPIARLINRLCEYEDTGLTSNDIETIKRHYLHNSGVQMKIEMAVDKLSELASERVKTEFKKLRTRKTSCKIIGVPKRNYHRAPNCKHIFHPFFDK